MAHTYSSLLARWVPHPLAALGLLLATAGAAHAQTATFTLQPNSPSIGAANSLRSMAIADVNGDGKLDALTANFSSSTLGVLLGNGAGGFVLQPNSPSTGAGSGPASVVIADVNGDGKPDALTANESSGTLGVLLGNGAGGFTLQPNSPSTGTVGTPPSVAIADVNGDGKLDALTPNLNGGTLGVLLGNGAGGFTLQPNSPSIGAGSVAIADVDGDGKLDALTTNFSSSTLGVLLGNGAGGFALQPNSPSTGAGSGPSSVAIADVNGDGRPDALTANYFTGTLGVLLNTTVFAPTLASISPNTASLRATDIAVYPNPAHARFTVVVPGLTQATTVQAELLDVLGQLVRRQAAALPLSGTQLTLETADLAPGVYTLRLQAGATTLAKRVVIE